MWSCKSETKKKGLYSSPVGDICLGQRSLIKIEADGTVMADSTFFLSVPLLIPERAPSSGESGKGKYHTAQGAARRGRAWPSPRPFPSVSGCPDTAAPGAEKQNKREIHKLQVMHLCWGLKTNWLRQNRQYLPMRQRTGRGSQKWRYHYPGHGLLLEVEPSRRWLSRTTGPPRAVGKKGQ